MPGDPVFLDTNGWLALLNASDALHATADALWKSLGVQNRSILVTDWIVAETGNGMARTLGRQNFAASVNLLRSSPRVQMIFVTEDIFTRALALYANRQDKGWGLVDCASFASMQQYGVRDGFTSDRHFEQAGFRCLLPHDPAKATAT
jgi:predicted nucleic acid-binding protein